MRTRRRSRKPADQKDHPCSQPSCEFDLHSHPICFCGNRFFHSTEFKGGVRLCALAQCPDEECKLWQVRHPEHKFQALIDAGWYKEFTGRTLLLDENGKPRKTKEDTDMYVDQGYICTLCDMGYPKLKGKSSNKKARKRSAQGKAKNEVQRQDEDNKQTEEQVNPNTIPEDQRNATASESSRKAMIRHILNHVNKMNAMYFAREIDGPETTFATDTSALVPFSLEPLSPQTLDAIPSKGAQGGLPDLQLPLPLSPFSLLCWDEVNSHMSAPASAVPIKSRPKPVPCQVGCGCDSCASTRRRLANLAEQTTSLDLLAEAVSHVSISEVD